MTALSSGLAQLAKRPLRREGRPHACPDSHLSHHAGDICLVLGGEVGRDLHQHSRLVCSLQDVPLLQHLEQHVARDDLETATNGAAGDQHVAHQL